MNQDIIKGHWHELKGKVKQQWGKLTDDDLTTLDGTYEELQGVLEKRYGYNKDIAKKQLDDFIKNQNIH
ncbi:CsbD family protein [soil metagenome]